MPEISREELINKTHAEFMARGKIHMQHPHIIMGFDSLVHWIVQARPVGSFLQAMIENNLRRTYENADEINEQFVRTYVQWLYNHAPSICWGSVENVAKWKGLVPMGIGK